MLWIRHNNRLVKTCGFFRGLAIFASVIVCSISTLPAQTDSLVSSAPTTASPAPSGVITSPSGQTVQTHASTGRFPPVTLNALDTATIKLQFATALAGTA